ncbi:DUF2859 domain-containing protein [Pseudorhodoferax soli]|uniref:Integrating conjugative element protein (TIGR03765 family) n=1 Tax=Pseudorhodoferax soli TaxID=545864 RepID=A0A368XEX3_9BURK|nr:DUF2859 domain-containing protein [Pseudorhodoferax soli]RCW66199.1 integrating conjugative element protein (TIGR03765 family) [Pseudorhodoferax soli]
MARELDVFDARPSLTIPRLAGCLPVLFAGVAHAAPVEAVFDSGRSIPIQPYLAVPGSVPEASTGWDGGAASDGAKPGAFPVTSSLKRGVLPHEVPVFDRSLLTQALVVTGTDRHSMAWLLLHRARLAAIDAKVVVVQAHAPQYLALARSMLPGLPIVLRNSSWIEDRLRAAGADVYPLLIGTDGVARQILPMDDPGFVPVAAGGQQ